MGIIDVAVFGGIGAITAIHHVAARKLAASGVDVAERSPAVKVDVVAGGAVHVNVQIARLVDLHVIECRVWCGGKASCAVTCWADKA